MAAEVRLEPYEEQLIDAGTFRTDHGGVVHDVRPVGTRQIEVRKKLDHTDRLHERAGLPAHLRTQAAARGSRLYPLRGLTTTNPTIGCCWDADRLDLGRVGIEPDPELMSTDAGRKRAPKWFWPPQDRNTRVSTKSPFST